MSGNRALLIWLSVRFAYAGGGCHLGVAKSGTGSIAKRLVVYSCAKESCNLPRLRSAILDVSARVEGSY